ncbi:MAG: nicotinamide mononucleotide transporter [Prevotella sp.]|nr:nicotinamide mononucleotide transporter [Prevotella sp.]
MDTLRLLDILGFTVGLIYLYLEYRASIWLWLASVVMPAVDMVLYYRAGLYADFGMAIYYCVAAIYGYAVWRFGAKKERRELPISHFPSRLVVPVGLLLLSIWWAIWWFLSRHTNSTVPVTDAFTTALSIVALWALARKYAEQWLMWLVVDAICCALYIYKGIPFKACIYGIYTLFAIFGYRKWLTMMVSSEQSLLRG